MASKNIYEDNSLRAVLHENVSLIWKGEDGREEREKSLSDSLEATQMFLMDHWPQKGECNFQFWNWSSDSAHI